MSLPKRGLLHGEDVGVVGKARAKVTTFLSFTLLTVFPYKETVFPTLRVGSDSIALHWC